ncbi:unnamed protein product, partial [Cyprideis torosa]
APAAAPTGRRGRKRKGVEPVPEEEEPAPTPLDKRRLVASTPAVAPEPAPAATPAAAVVPPPVEEEPLPQIPQNVPMANMGYDATAAAAAEQPPPEQPRTPWSTRAPGTPFESNPPSVAAPQLPGEDEEKEEGETEEQFEERVTIRRANQMQTIIRVSFEQS